MRSSTNGVKSGSERRKWVRLPLAIPVFVRSRDHNSNEILEFTTILNVSAGGMLVAVRKVPRLSSEIRLEIPSVPVSAPATISKASRGLRARVLRSTPVEGYTLLGLKFSHPLLASPNRPKSRKRKAISVG
jgi:c-di-GMP-binding flagellar brake protein YcgR